MSLANKYPCILVWRGHGHKPSRKMLSLWSMCVLLCRCRVAWKHGHKTCREKPHLWSLCAPLTECTLPDTSESPCCKHMFHSFRTDLMEFPCRKSQLQNWSCQASLYKHTTSNTVWLPRHPYLSHTCIMQRGINVWVNVSVVYYGGQMHAAWIKTLQWCAQRKRNKVSQLTDFRLLGVGGVEAGGWGGGGSDFVLFSKKSLWKNT